MSRSGDGAAVELPAVARAGLGFGCAFASPPSPLLRRAQTALRSPLRIVPRCVFVGRPQQLVGFEVNPFRPGPVRTDAGG